jgi:hypothetical protein
MLMSDSGKGNFALRRLAVRQTMRPVSLLLLPDFSKDEFGDETMGPRVGMIVAWPQNVVLQREAVPRDDGLQWKRQDARLLQVVFKAPPGPRC